MAPGCGRTTASSARPHRRGAMACGTARWRRSRSGSRFAHMPASSTPPGVMGEMKVWRRNGWIATKDLGRTDEDGYFFHGGRADDVIISAGWTMSAIEIEDAVLKHPDVREVGAIGVPDALRGQVVKAFVVADRTGDEPFAKEIQDLVRQRLSQHEYPRL